MRDDRTAKVRRISIDTNVISDIPPFYALSQKQVLHEEEKRYFQRCQQSFDSIVVILDHRVERAGIKIVSKELSQRHGMLALYRYLFKRDATVTKEARQLAEAYSKRLGIGNADAVILALCSIAGVDLFLSWNRDDIANDETYAEIMRINKKRNIPTPLLRTPKEFLECVIESDDKTLGLSPRPVLPVYRLNFCPSK